MSFILQALKMGYNNKDILDFISKNIPKLATAVKQALNAGYSDDDIVNYLDNVFENPESRKRITQNKLDSILQKKKLEKTQNLKKMITSFALPYGLGVATNLIGGAFQQPTPSAPPNLPGSPQPNIPPQGGLPPIPPNLGGSSPNFPPQIPSNTPQTPPIPPNLGQIPPKIPPDLEQITPKKSIKQPGELSIEGMRKQFEESEKARSEEGKILTAAKKMLAKPDQASSMTKDQVKSIFTLNDEEADAVLKIFHDQTRGLYLKPKEAVIPQKPEEAIKEAQTDYKKASEVVPNISKDALKSYESINQPLPKIDISKVKKGESVITPQNEIGEIKSFTGSKALVDVNGKLKPIDFDKLELTPDELKKTKIVIDPSQIDETAKSAMLGAVTHSPDKKFLKITFGESGDTYTYYRKDGKPIDDKIIDMIKEGSTEPVTSGDTYLGFWDASTPDTRGGAANKYITKQSQDVSDEIDDPSKPMYYYKEVNVFKHGLFNEVQNAIKKMSKQYRLAKKLMKGIK